MEKVVEVEKVDIVSKRIWTFSERWALMLGR